MLECIIKYVQEDTGLILLGNFRRQWTQAQQSQVNYNQFASSLWYLDGPYINYVNTITLVHLHHLNLTHRKNTV